MERVGLARRLYDNYPSQLRRPAPARRHRSRAHQPPAPRHLRRADIGVDAPVQSQILNLLQDCAATWASPYLLISHNLAVVGAHGDEVAVMYLGRIVEEAETDELFRAPKHPFTQALLASVLTPEPGLGVPDTQLGAAYPNPLDMPPGCRFHPRCARVMERCRSVPPKPVAAGASFVECHLYGADQHARLTTSA